MPHPSRLRMLGALLGSAVFCAAGALNARAARPALPVPSPWIAPVERTTPGEDDNPARLVQTTSLIRASQARQTYDVDGTGLAVAVLDTGLRTTHVDFAGKIVARRNFTTENGGQLDDVTDGHGHGTNVAGIAIARGNHIGIAPGASIIPLKVLKNDGSGVFSDAEEALQWVLDNRTRYNISVVNLSLGDGRNYTTVDPGRIQDEIRALRAVNVAVVASAGNEFYRYASAQGMTYPAALPETVSVGAVFDANVGALTAFGARAATTGPNRLCPFSQRLSSTVNAATRTDIFAPGAVLTATGNTGNTASASFVGTSQASPVVSGVILLMQEYYRHVRGALPSVDQVESWLRTGAVSAQDGDDENDNVTNTGATFLRVDALGALVATAAGANTYSTVSGKITTGGLPLGGVAVKVGALSVLSTSTGAYSIGRLLRGTYTVTPSKTGYAFTPTQRTVTVGPSQTGVDFTAAPLSRPLRPTALRVPYIGSREVGLTWKDNSSNESGFVIEARKPGQPFSPVLTAGPDVQAGQLDVQPNTTYYFRARSFNAAGNSPYSRTKRVKTPR